MSKRKFLIPFATFGLLLSCLVACGGGNNESKPDSSNAGGTSSQETGESSSKQEESSSKQDESSSKQGESSSQQGSSSSQGGDSSQQAHEHDYQQVGEAVKNADGKDVKLFECKDKDDKYLAMAFADYSEKNEDFDSAANATKYKEVAADLWTDAVMLAKTKTAKVTWKFNLDKAVSGAKLEFGLTSTYASHGNTSFADKYLVQVNGAAATSWDATGTYTANGLAPTKRVYITFKTIDLVEGENVITIQQNNTENRLLHGGEMRIHYSGDAKPVEAPFPGYDITFNVEHCKVLVYSTKQYTTETPVETLTAKAKNELGEIVAYDPEDIELQPQVSFKVVCDEGYSCTANNVSVTPAGKFKNLKQNPDNVEGQDDIYRVTKVQDNLTITISPVQGEQEPGYKVTFVPEHCEIKVYVGPKDETGSNLDTPQEGGFYYARLKDSPFDVGYTNPQVNFEVIPEEGYSFNPIIDENNKVDFITHPNAEKAGYNKFSDKGGYYNLTKVDDDLTITVKAYKPISQPIGTFFATPELTAGGQLPILVQLGDNNAVAVRVNGQDVPNCVIKSYDKSTGEMVITITGMGDASVTYNPETGLLEKLSLLWDKTLLKYDAGVSMYGNEKLKYWNCDGTTEQLQAEWNRRYGNPWTLDTVNADRVTQNTEHYISGSAMRLRPFSGDRFSLATKDFANKFNARNISFWVYNSGEADAKIQSFAYTKTGYSTDGMVQPFGTKTIPTGKWTYVSAGFNASDLYGFQIFVEKTASALIFDDICLF